MPSVDGCDPIRDPAARDSEGQRGRFPTHGELLRQSRHASIA
jgi:hypothetical protein